MVSGIGTIPFLLLETLKDLELSEQSIENWIGKLGMPLTFKTIQMIGIGSMVVSAGLYLVYEKFFEKEEQVVRAKPPKQMKFERRTCPIVVILPILFFIAAAVCLGKALVCDSEVWVLAFIILIAAGVKNYATESQYFYDDTGMNLTFFGIKYRKISYSEYEMAVISNPVCTGRWYGLKRKCIQKMQQKTEEATPFITLHKVGYPVWELKPGMDYSMLKSKKEKRYCVGNCSLNALTELLKYSNWKVYVLEDVYLNDKEMFDTAFSQYESGIGRFFIVTEQGVVLWQNF